MTHDGAARDADEVASEIAQTREELDQTLEELGRKLDPGHLKAEARSYVASRGREARETVTAWARANPTAVAAAAGGALAAIVLLRRRSAHHAAARHAEQVRALLGLLANGAAGSAPAAAAREHLAATGNGAGVPRSRHRGATLLATLGLALAVRAALQR